VPLTLAPPERAELESFARSRALPAGLVRRAQMLLLSADGVTNTAIAERFATSVSLVSLWRRRYRGQGCARTPKFPHFLNRQIPAPDWW